MFILYLHTYSCVKDYLKNMLREHLAHHKTHHEEHMHPIFTELSPAQIIEDLRHQLEAYWHNEWPFDIPVKDGNPLAWWKSLGKHVHACILSVHIL
jgi:hypothetical protein